MSSRLFFKPKTRVRLSKHIIKHIDGSSHINRSFKIKSFLDWEVYIFFSVVLCFILSAQEIVLLVLFSNFQLLWHKSAGTKYTHKQ